MTIKIKAWTDLYAGSFVEVEPSTFIAHRVQNATGAAIAFVCKRDMKKDQEFTRDDVVRGVFNAATIDALVESGIL